MDSIGGEKSLNRNVNDGRLQRRPSEARTTYAHTYVQMQQKSTQMKTFTFETTEKEEKNRRVKKAEFVFSPTNPVINF
jgi:hypothetical protein